MIVNVIEIFVEYLSIILCLHKITGKEIKIDRYVIGFSLLNFISVIVAYKYQQECRYLMVIMYINFIIYTKLRLTKKWIETIRTFGIMFVVIPSLQLVSFFGIKFLFVVFNIAQNRYVMGLVANCIVCLLIIFWKKQYVSISANLLGKAKEIFIPQVFCLFFIYLLYFYKQSDYVNKFITLQSFVAIVGVSTISILWLNAENEKKIKAKELRLYEIYNKTFEDAITAIRLRQHEFDNHINAIKCMQLTVNDYNDLIKVQNEYCDRILNENSFNSLLKLHEEPILVGFLYSKFMKLKEKGMDIWHEVHAIRISDNIEVNEVIEVLGVLLDNAEEALLDLDEKERNLIVKILQEKEGRVSLEVSNRSRKYLNSEIEKFCIYGFSTKGEKRGIGLARVKDIVKKYKAEFFIENVNYCGKNYLSFKIILR